VTEAISVESILPVGEFDRWLGGADITSLAFETSETS
jgi:hypothetical protein